MRIVYVFLLDGEMAMKAKGKPLATATEVLQVVLKVQCKIYSVFSEKCENEASKQQAEPYEVS